MVGGGDSEDVRVIYSTAADSRALQQVKSSAAQQRPTGSSSSSGCGGGGDIEQLHGAMIIAPWSNSMGGDIETRRRNVLLTASSSRPFVTAKTCSDVFGIPQGSNSTGSDGRKSLPERSPGAEPR